MPKKVIEIKTTIVIVESPAKCKKIEEYLGPGYKCIASFGHLRELASLENIKTKENYKPIYTIINQPIKRKQIDLIKKEVAAAYEVILACDADREGEAICFHLCELFGLSIEKTKRILFHEITPNAIKEAIKNPQTINMHLVQAQQARQVLDLLVGFKITPLLWKYISKNNEHSLSAGRCQTPALKIIYENQQEINNNIEERIHRVTGYFTNLNIPFTLNKEFGLEEEVTDFLFGSSTFQNYYYSCSKPEKVFKKQPEPFSTSTLQQKASNEFHYSPKETMKIAQQLYEGGFITYMRTDCKLYSKEFVQSTKEYIIKTWDEKYVNKEEASTHTRTTNVEKDDVEAPHEAIRPTNIELKELPITVTDAKQRKLYNCIWENTLESCMAPASYYSICARIEAFNKTFFNNKSEQIDFLGWKAVKNVNNVKKTTENKEYHYLQTITPNMILTYKKMVSNVTLKNTKSHYTEARLVQILEEKGIGRPSTFSSIVEKIQEREYVKKENISGKTILCKEYELENGDISEVETNREFGNEKNKLVIQPLGIMVIEFLEKHFSSLFQYDYTREMEDNLDKVAKGEKIWYSLCESCDLEVNDKIQSMKDGKERKIEYFVDENHVYIIGKHGPVIKYLDPITKETSFKSVKKDIDMERLKAGSYSLDEIIEKKELDQKKENTFGFGIFENEQVILKKGKYGLYITWGSKKKNLKELGNRPIESIRFEEIEKILQEDSSGDIIREISDNIQIRKGKKNSDYIFFKTSKMKKPQFFSLNHFKENYRTCDKESIQHWIKETYNVY